jgi:hypothetical protein
MDNELKVTSSQQLLPLREVETESMVPTLVRMNTLMGGGNDAQAMLAYSAAVRELWPDMSVDIFEKSLRYGLVRVKWFGKLTIPAIAEFIREYEQYRRDQTTKPWHR